MRLKEKLCNYLTLITHKSTAFSAVARGHAFAFHFFSSFCIVFFLSKYFSLNGLLCFVLFSFTKFITVFFFLYVLFSLSLFFQLLWITTKEEKKRSDFFSIPLLSKFSRLVLTDNVTHTYTSRLQIPKRARVSLFSAYFFFFVRNNFIKQNK